MTQQKPSRKRRPLRTLVLLLLIVTTTVALAFAVLSNKRGEIENPNGTIGPSDPKVSSENAEQPANKASGNSARTIKYNGVSFDTYTVDITTSQLRIYFKDPRGNKFRSLQALKKYVADNSGKLIFATNAGMYTPDGDPEGLLVDNSNSLSPLNLKDGTGNFYLKPNGVFGLTKDKAFVVESSEYESIRSKNTVKLATQSGPMLLINGNIHPAFKKGSANKLIRSAVGLISPTRIVFVISNDPINFYDLAEFFRDYFKCSAALYLDGVVSRMYLPEINRRDTDGSFAGIIALTE